MDLNNKNKKVRGHNKGLIAALGCNTVWGILPIYWQSLKPIDTNVIILYRIVLMACVCYIPCAITMGWRNVFKPMYDNKKQMAIYILAGILITSNWSIYIWAVNAGYVIQTAMGYFLEPLIVCLFGIIFYKEVVNFPKKIALFFAVLGLLVMIIGYRQIPIIALALAITFAVYAAVKKTYDLNPFQSLLYETILLMPIALGIIVKIEVESSGAFSQGNSPQITLLFLAGIMTAIPLGLFSFAAKELPLVTLGLTEYLSPTISLFLGIFLFKEEFHLIQLLAFSLILIGLIFFTYGEIKDSRGDEFKFEENQH